ncbi:MAG: hypothetical protein ACKVQU_19815 [Burkholderiales bacterium]
MGAISSLPASPIMAHLRAELHKEIEANNISDVVFQDPLQTETRAAKQNLVASSVAALLIASLELQVSGFLDPWAATGAVIGTAITKGIACLIVGYFLVGFIFAIYVDYSAWKFKKERYLVKPYLELTCAIEARIHAVTEQLQNATSRLGSLSLERGMQDQIEDRKIIDGANGQVASINEQTKSFYEEVRPLLKHSAAVIAKANFLTWRLRVRMLSFWALDVITPVLLGAVAIWKAYQGVPVVTSRVAG